MEYELRLGFNDAPKSFCFALGRLMGDWRPPKTEALPSGIERLSLDAASGLRVRIWNSPLNLFKEPMSRLLYHDVPLETEYAVWFDDDSYVAPGWWPALAAVMESGAQYIGQPWWVHYLPGQADMIRSMPWYREIPFDDRDGKPGTWFMTGGFMAIRSECLKVANFPDVDFVWKDERLQQYGGDTLLGEIARQSVGQRDTTRASRSMSISTINTLPRARWHRQTIRVGS